METIKESFGSVSLVIQGDHRFYSLTIPSDTLASTCYVISREEDQLDGFQRRLDVKRAQEIAAYIDSGLGTVPSSIILSAQENANLEYDSKRKSIRFNIDPHSFLIIDGQHRIYGFTMAKKKLRIPVVIYDGLSRRDETRLFIDINSKQKGVPPELLLDIKKLAEYENTQEEYLRELFDMFEKSRKSVLYGHLSPATKRQGHLTRANFNSALKSILKSFGTRECSEIYEILNCYFAAFFQVVLDQSNIGDLRFNPTLFKATCTFFNSIAPRVKDRFGSIYSFDNFSAVLEQVGRNVKAQKLKSSGSAYKPIVQALEESLKGDFTL